MKNAAFGIYVCAFLGSVVLGQERRELPEGGKDAKTDAAGETLVRFRINPQGGFYGNIISSNPEGEVRLAKPPARPWPPEPHDLVEGYYLGTVTKGPPRRWVDGALLVRAQVIEIADEHVRVQVGPTAAKQISPGGVMVIYRPLQTTTAHLKSAPVVATIAEGESNVLKQTDTDALIVSMNNLKQIGVAMHGYHDTYRRFPPAVVYGPDGKPWHSWRVLLLPFLDQQPLYEQYRFEEPWDGPNNKKLLEKIPPVYRDPIYGEPLDYYTHYAAITGKGTAFPGGISFDGNPKNLFTGIVTGQDPPGNTRLADFVDGTSNSLFAGSLNPERKIPWMKPEDVPFTADFPALGAKEGFAAPYRFAEGAFGVFLRADGSAFTILESAPIEEFRKLLTISDRQVVGTIPGLKIAVGRVFTIPIFEIVRTPGGFLARVTYEPNVREFQRQ